MRKLMLAAAAACALAVSAPALAADGTTLFGGATVDDGVATLVENTGNTSATDDFSGITVPVPTGLTFGQITQLSAEFNVTDDDCAAGSPRFQVKVGGKNVHVAFGPAATLTGCLQNTWLSTGNLTQAQASECRVDTSQFVGGTQCSSWAAAVTLLGSQPVEGVNLVVDASWTGSTSAAFADKEQTVLVRNVMLNDKTFLVPEAPKPPKLNPTTACKAQLATLGRAAFNEEWSTSGTSNGFGKCVSEAAKAQRVSQQSLNALQSKVMTASKSCKAKGLKGEKLGQCVAANDRVAATKTEAQEKKAAKKRRR
jgi:hypothetical protein